LSLRQGMEKTYAWIEQQVMSNREDRSGRGGNRAVSGSGSGSGSGLERNQKILSVAPVQ
jgi:hypothetical protein